jgi:hypothetical protein
MSGCATAACYLRAPIRVERKPYFVESPPWTSTTSDAIKTNDIPDALATCHTRKEVSHEEERPQACGKDPSARAECRG